MSDRAINGFIIFGVLLIACFVGFTVYNINKASNEIENKLHEVESMPMPKPLSLGERADRYLACDWSELHKACFCVGILSTSNPELDTKSFTWVPPSVCGK